MSSSRNQLDFKIKDMTKDKESSKNIVGIIKSRGQSQMSKYDGDGSPGETQSIKKQNKNFKRQ